MKVWLLWEELAEKGDNPILRGVFISKEAAERNNEEDIADGSLSIEERVVMP